MHLKYIQIILLTIVFALQFLFEHIFPQKKENNNWKNERYNLLVGLFNLLLTFIPAGLLVQWVHFIEKEKLGLLHQFEIPFVVRLIITLLVLDFWMYGWHSFNHRWPFLWRFHSFHHKDKKMNSTTALRFHVIELFLSYPGKAVVCFVFGISFLPLLVYEIAFFSATVIHHSNVYMSEKADNIYRIFFASPRMHRIHHSIKLDESNSNFGSLFSFWDRVFNTWTHKAKDDIIFGVPSSSEKVEIT